MNLDSWTRERAHELDQRADFLVVEAASKPGHAAVADDDLVCQLGVTQALHLGPRDVLGAERPARLGVPTASHTMTLRARFFVERLAIDASGVRSRRAARRRGKSEGKTDRGTHAAPVPRAPFARNTARPPSRQSMGDE